MNTFKPLGIKSYGSIPHLPGSRVGPSDHHINEGQANIATLKARNKHDVIIVQEKLDGSNVGVAKINGEIVPLTRSGYHCDTSPYIQHHFFSKWVSLNYIRFHDLLNDGERVCGEWLVQAHGTRYKLPHEPFVSFDIFSSKTRLPFEEFKARAESVGLIIPHIISIGSPVSIKDALDILGDNGKHGAIDFVEGAIWRVENRGKVDFLTKYVVPGKIDGCYLPGITGKEVWNYDCDLLK